LKYTLKKICADGNKQVAHVQISDDSGNDLGEICVPYEDDEEKFKTALTQKVAKLETIYSAAASAKQKIENILKNCEVKK